MVQGDSRASCLNGLGIYYRYVKRRSDVPSLQRSLHAFEREVRRLRDCDAECFGAVKSARKARTRPARVMAVRPPEAAALPTPRTATGPAMPRAVTLATAGSAVSSVPPAKYAMPVGANARAVCSHAAAVSHGTSTGQGTRPRRGSPI